jgi:hypothetical protein
MKEGCGHGVLFGSVCYDCEVYEAEREERAMQAGMAGGVDAYNEARGYYVDSPEPCGHHCPSDCPRCGEP